MIYGIMSYFSQQLLHSLIFRTQLLLTPKEGTPPWPFKSNTLTLSVIFTEVWLIKEQTVKACFWLGIWPWNSGIAGVMFEVYSRICLTCSLCKRGWTALSTGLLPGRDESPEVRLNYLVHWVLEVFTLDSAKPVADVSEMRLKTSLWKRTQPFLSLTPYESHPHWPLVILS